MYVITDLSDHGAALETRRTREGAIFRAWTLMTSRSAIEVRVENRLTGEIIEGQRIVDLAATLAVSGPFE